MATYFLFLFWGEGACNARTHRGSDGHEAEICRVTANVLITYDRQVDCRTYAEGEFERSAIPCDARVHRFMMGAINRQKRGLLIADIGFHFRERKVRSATNDTNSSTVSGLL